MAESWTHLDVEAEAAGPSESIAYSASWTGDRRPGARLSRVANEAKLARNLEAQRRSKQRQKANESHIEMQLSETTARLHELEQQKALLEARNALLEKISYLNAQVSALSQLNDEATAEDQDEMSPGPPYMELEASNHLFVSPLGKPRSLVTEKVGKLSLSELSNIWTEYVYEIGACLLQLDFEEDLNASSRLHQLTSEAMNLIATRTRLDRSVLHAVMHQDVLDMHSNADQPCTHQLDQAFYTRILVIWKLSDGQITDLMHLRQLFLTRRCTLSLERKALMSQLQRVDSQVLNPTDNMAEVADVTNALQQNASEDYQMYYKIARSMYRGVLSIKQVAGLLVHAYPFVSSMEPVLELLAEKGQGLSRNDIIAAAALNPMTAEWEQFIEYYMIVGAVLYPEYLPMRTCPLVREPTF